VTYFADLSASARKELWAVLALRHARGIGVRRAQRLADHFGSALHAVEHGLSSPKAWASLPGIPPDAAGDFAAGSWRDGAAKEWRAIQDLACAFLLRSDAEYPEPLRHIADPPLLLYCKGDLSLLRGPAVAVVGARQCTREGVAVSAFFSRGLSRAGVSVISGMARGIDRSAHLAGMEGPGRSIAVLGTGIDVCYPLCNRDLYDLLGARGLLLSELPPGAGALSAHFPVRNRLISGLSQGVLVVEAADRSGSLITARIALEQNRDVFAVPGHTMAEVSAGCRRLIRLGAKAVFNADDILWDLAPLLTLEARDALDKRRKQEEEQGGAERAPRLRAVSSAETVLPRGDLPRIAEAPRPDGKNGIPRKRARGKKTASRPGLLPATPSPAPEETPPAHGPAKTRAPLPPGLSPDECRVMAGLSADDAHIDALAQGLDMDIAKLSGILAVLEVRGLVRRAPGMRYALP
jgi:DNA processing protein